MKTRRITTRELAVHAVLLVALLVPLFPGVFFQGHVLLPGELLFNSVPWKAYAPADYEPRPTLTLEALCEFHLYYTLARRAVDNGEWPLWNHLEYTGMPLMANYQSAVFYPPRLIHSFLNLYLATTLYILMKLWLCGATAYLCARGIGLRVPGARIFSVAWMLMTHHTIWCYWPHTDVGAWLPIIFLGVEWTLDGRYRRGFCVTAIGATLILLAGHPETAFAMGFGAGVYFLLRLVWDRRWGKRLWRPAAVAGGAWAVAIAVCSIQILPFLEYMVNSYQYVAHGDPEDVALPVGAWVLLWVPKFYGMTAEGNYWGPEIHSNFTNHIFPGLAVWFGIPLLKGMRAWDKRRRARTVCLLVTSVFFFLCAIDYSGLRWLLRMPVLDVMWYRYFTWPCLFALGLAGAHGIDAWYAKPRRLHELAWAIVPALAVGGTVFGLYWFHSTVLTMQGMDGYVKRQMAIAALAAVGCLVCLGGACVLPRPKVWAALLALVLAADLVHAVRGVHPTAPRAWLFPETKLTDYLKEQPQPYRVTIETAVISTGFMPMYGIEEYFGYGGILPLRFSRFFRQMGEDSWNAMMPALGVRYFVHDADREPFFLEYAPGRFRKDFEGEGAEVYIYEDAMERAYLVPRGRVIADVDAMLGVMRDPAFDPRAEALLEAPLPDAFKGSSLKNLGTARVTERLSTRVTVEADACDECILVLGDAYYPGWRATIDGDPAGIFPVYSIYRGVVLSEGKHTVEFTYMPPSFQAGLGISSLVLCASAALSLVHLARRRRTRTA